MKLTLSSLLIGLLLLTSACAEETVYALDSGNQSSVARIIGDASATECPNGGVVLGYGIDEDGNGELSTDEIDGTTVICNGTNGQDGTDGVDGSNGADALVDRVSISEVEAGELCANGGVAISHGIDTNENGILDAGEIEETETVCHGESSGVNGGNSSGVAQSLIRVVSVVAGGDCANGGARIDTGIDTNDNSVLDDEEVTDSVYVCNGLDGASAPMSMVDVTRIESADGCDGAAIQVVSGVDADGNGTLEGDEVSSTELICEPNTSGNDCSLEDIDGVKVLTCGDTSAVVLEEPNRIVASITCVGMLEGEDFSFDYSVAQLAYGDVFASASVRDIYGQTGASAYFSLQQIGFETAPVIFSFDVYGDPDGGYWTISLDRDTLETTVQYDDVDTSGLEATPVTFQWVMMSDSCILNSY